MKKTFGLYFHPETSKQLSGLAPQKSVYDFIQNRDSIQRKSSIPLTKVDITEFLSVHTTAYLDSLIALSQNLTPETEPRLSIECENLYDFLPGFEYGLGGMYATIDLMKKGILDRAYCYSLPGHHAHPAFGHGYCLLNPIAAGVRYAQRNGFHKILIVDWDFHHGEGTQTIFENDPSVYHISLHNCVDLYMSLIRVTNLGFTTYGKKVGHCNIPIMDRRLGDIFYKEILGDEFSGELYNASNCLHVFYSALQNLPFDPDMIFIFDGHDSHKDDLGEAVTDWGDKDFTFLAKAVLDVANKFGCPVISSPAGGYNIETLQRLTKLHLKILEEY
jgi:acetoin utilization deacetylase AcuC-like enzyme